MPDASFLQVNETGSILFGACAFYLPGLARDGACHYTNGQGVLLNVPVQANMTQTWLRLEWESGSTQTDELALTVGASECASDECDYEVFFMEAGPSPLEWRVDDLRALAPDGWTFFAYVHFQPLIDDPVWLGAGGFGQEYRMVGEFRIEA